MEVTADLHLHSKYSRAVSQQMEIPQIALWAAKKGIRLVGTGDWTHPLWLRELKENLEEVAQGLYGLRATGSVAGSSRPTASPAPLGPGARRDALRPRHPSPLFLLSTEISSIYTQNGKPHRIHNLVLAPNFSVAEKINDKLRLRGVNLLSDGRPMTGISSRDLTELVMETDKNCLVISAHAWTPWYSLYGSQSGFDSINECYQDMSKFIYAIETGLSSDPAMNWRIAELDNRSIVSFSDAHSPQKLGREATVFEFKDIKKLRYEDIREAIIGRSVKQFRIVYTIEFYPEEGKYHWTGHRNCGVKQSPDETQKLGSTCPVCGKKLTIGVMHRVEQLSNRTMPASQDSFGIEQLKENFDKPGVRWINDENRPPYVMMVPLMEILADVFGVGVSSQNVEIEYNRLTGHFGSEFEVLLKAPIKQISKISGEKVAEGILRVREGQVFVDPGYDGVFGTVKIWASSEGASEGEEKQMSLF